MRMCVIVEDFITVGWCKCDCDFENVLLWYQDTHTKVYLCLDISEREKKIVKYFATRSGISYKYNSLRPLNISSNFIFLVNYGHYVKSNSKYGFSNHWKIGITLDSSGKISWYMRFSCSSGCHIGLFSIRSPGAHPNLFAMVFRILLSIPITIPNFKNLSPSARFDLYMAYSSPAIMIFSKSIFY